MMAMEPSVCTMRIVITVTTSSSKLACIKQLILQLKERNKQQSLEVPILSSFVNVTIIGLRKLGGFSAYGSIDK